MVDHLDRMQQAVNRDKDRLNHGTTVWTEDAAFALAEVERLTGVLKEAHATAFERAADTGSNAWSDLYFFLNAALDVDEEGRSLPLPQMAPARGPLTSHAAAASIDDMSDRHFAVLDVLRDLVDATDAELVIAYRQSKWMIDVPQEESSIRTRRNELVEGGWAYWTFQYRASRSGRKAMVWKAREEARVNEILEQSLFGEAT